MDIYDVNLVNPLFPKGKRFKSFLSLFAIGVLTYFMIELVSEWVRPARRESDWIFWMLGKAVFWGLWISTVFSFRKAAQYPIQYQIFVDEDEISSRNFKSMNRLSSRTIPRFQIKTFMEQRAGLMISRYNRVGTFLWGGIWIPKQLADYEYLKRVVSNWRVENE